MQMFPSRDRNSLWWTKQENGYQNRDNFIAAILPYGWENLGKNPTSSVDFFIDGVFQFSKGIGQFSSNCKVPIYTQCFAIRAGSQDMSKGFYLTEASPAVVVLRPTGSATEVEVGRPREHVGSMNGEEDSGKDEDPMERLLQEGSW
ncbi:hypothetical protein ANN_12502 [Periplaneta americana]|uniref:Uncharacterized protein n=1 Tax=Periplaneta americana TaxID=6978 RepID=A0ABQ8TJ89_PERAM|nr:hypothetical protein ANN_12502 [Periplaneta americana]